jgi:hypothetical protein
MQRHQLKRRRIMREFRIHELSAVDRPAQEGAVAVIVKRYPQEHVMQFHKIGGDRVASFGTLDEAVAHLAKAHGMPKLDAMEKAAAQYPDLVRRFNEDGERIGKAAAAAAAPRPASRALLAFQDRVDQIAKRDGCPRYVAMERARERYADEFSAAYGE